MRKVFHASTGLWPHEMGGDLTNAGRKRSQREIRSYRFTRQESDTSFIGPCHFLPFEMNDAISKTACRFDKNEYRKWPADQTSAGMHGILGALRDMILFFWTAPAFLFMRVSDGAGFPILVGPRNLLRLFALFDTGQALR